MTLSQEHIDQMLSGYLDDALSGEECAEVKRWLDRDSAIKRQWTELCELRDSLRAIGKSDRNLKLDSGFAGRVLEAAVARARAEGLAEEHPLVRVSEQPTSIRPDGRSISWARLAGVVIAIAASLAFAVTMLSPTWSSKGRPSDASSALAANPLQNVPVLAPEVLETPSMAPVSSQPRNSEARVDSIASAKESVSERSPTNDMVRVPNPDASKIDEVTATSPPSQLSSADSLAVTHSISAVLVLDVRQTSKGRATGAVRRAMRSSSIGQSNQKSVNVDIAAAATDSAEISGDDKVSLFYLQAPAKSLDRFYMSLLADREGVESVGMTIAMDAPVLEVVNSVHPDPTTVAHQGTMLFPGDRDSTRQLTSRLSELNFLPLDPALVGGVSVDSGPDVNSQVLVLVR